MKRYFLMLLMGMAWLSVCSQEVRPFDVTVHNDEYKIYMKMNLYDKSVTVPGQDFLGEMDGYISSTQSRSMWMIVSSRLIDERTAEIEVVNDYGSEDFKAVVKVEDDGTYSYKKKEGSTLKFAVKGKWQKIPGSVTFVSK